MRIPGNVFDRQHAQRDSDELHNDSRNLAISLAILRTTKRNFKAESGISKLKFAQKRRISRSYCSEWIKRSKQPAR